MLQPVLDQKRQFLRGFLLFLLVYIVLVILWGAYVRATGSGAGCGSHWPLCNGDVLPIAPSLKTQIEFTHRIMSGISLILVMIVGYWTTRIYPVLHPMRKAARVAVISILLEALIGAGLVIFDLVYKNQSIKRALSISLHFTNTLVLVGALTLMMLWSRRSQVSWKWPSLPVKRQILFFIGLFCFVGMAGAITALGDTLFPASSLADGIRQDWSSASHFLIRLRIFHPILAVIFAALVSPWIFSQLNQEVEKKRWGKSVLFLLVFNLCLGVSNLVWLAPLPLQMIHLGIGISLWIAWVGFLDQVMEVSE